MQVRVPMNLYRTPFTPAYWREANLCAKSLKMLLFAALMIAMTRALSLIPGIPIAHTKLTWGFLARSMCGLVCGPIMGLIFGFVEDMLGFILQPSGDFFFGYTLSTMVGVLVYALMGTVWTVMVRGGVYWAWFVPSLAKNLITILPKAAVQYVLFQTLLPILQHMDIIPRQVQGAIKPF